MELLELEKLLPHQQNLCWCGFEHARDGECNFAEWTGKIILRCHEPAIIGERQCLNHLPWGEPT